MLNSQKILLLGPVSPPVSGPGVKNKMLLEWLLSSKEFQVRQLNTHDFRKLAVVKIFISLIHFLITKKIILSVSKNGRYLFIPICIFLRKKVFLFPAGGSFDIEINSLSSVQKKVFLFFCRRVKATFVQTTNLKYGLERLGFKNVVFLPNPRLNNNQKAVVKPNGSAFKLVFLSKIREGKGPLLLIDAVSEVKARIPDVDISLDFYGVVDPHFESKFQRKLKENSFSYYKGVCDPEEVQKTISEYDLFVLPTFFPEGVPGAVIEAMFTRIPIVISNYTAAQEMIEDGVDGLIVQQKEIVPLVDAIFKIIVDYELRIKFSENIYLKSKKYNYDDLMLVVKDYLIGGE